MRDNNTTLARKGSDATVNLGELSQSENVLLVLAIEQYYAILMKLQLLLPGIPVPVFSGGSSEICLTQIAVVYTDTNGVSSNVLVL